MMKKVLSSAAMLCLAIPCFAQTSTHKMLDLYSATNVPISRTYSMPVSFQGWKFDLVKLTDLTDDKIYGGIRILTERQGKLFENVLDKSEALLFAKTLQKYAQGGELDSKTYVELTSSNGFQFKISDANQLRIWGYTFVINKSTPQVYTVFAKSELEEISARFNELAGALVETL